MKTIRIGNDIVIDWAIVRNGRPEDFRAKTLSLFICSRYGKESVKSFAVNGNSLRFSFLGKCQRYTGDYGLLLIVNDGSGGMFSVDLDRAFCLTQHSDCGCDGVIELMSDIALPANGLSAYELAVINGYEGTEQEWLESLVQPAKDAASEALAAAGRADSATETAIATNTAVQQAERLRVASEQERVSAESQRTKAEQVRTTAESDRYKAEQARVTAESQRAKAEQQRGTAESARAAAETGRTNAETSRELSETERKQSEETRIASEQTRTSAESVRVKSEESRRTAESARQKAETKRQQDTATVIKNAETATQEATKAAELANSVSTPSGNPMHYMFEYVGAKWDVASGKWLMNELELTNDEMAEVYTFGNLANSNGSDWQNRLTGYKGKTTIPYRQQLGLYLNTSLDFRGAFASCENLEVLVFASTYAFPKYVDFLFYASPKLRKVLQVIDMRDCQSAERIAKSARALEDIKLKNVKISLSFPDSPLLNNESILYLITNAENKSITITLHPDAYDRAMSDSGITSALATKPLITLAK